MTTRPLVIFGARSGLGLEIATLARQQGRTVFAGSRPGADTQALSALGCTLLSVDVMDGTSVETAFATLPDDLQIISTIGGSGRPAANTETPDQHGNQRIIDASRHHGRCSHFMLISSLGAGDSRQYASPPLLAAIGPVLLAKTAAEDHLRASGLPFTIIRPGGLTSGPATGTGTLSDDMSLHGFISRKDLASLSLEALGSSPYQGKTLAAIDPCCPPPPRPKH